MRVLFDNCMPPRLAHAINLLVETEGHQVVALRDRMDGNTPDTDWIAELGDEGGWVVFTHDRMISRRPHEKAALQATDLVVCFFESSWAQADFLEQAYRMLKHWRTIAAAVSDALPGSSLTVKIGGRIDRQIRS